jgi:hypothetical protein
MLTYKPLIGAIEAGLDIGFVSDSVLEDKFRPGSVLEQFVLDYKERFGDVPYLGGARGLEVVDVDEPFRIHEYDGSESVEVRERMDWFDPETDFIELADEDFE